MTIYTCDVCGYALLTKEELGTRITAVFFEGVGWEGVDDTIFPYECKDRFACFRRANDLVAGRSRLEAINNRPTFGSL